MYRRKAFPCLVFMFILGMIIISCSTQFGSVVITKPDEHKNTYEAGEKAILKAIAKVFSEKDIGSNVTIDSKKNTVESDYIYRNEWRTKSSARVKKLNWKECEVALTVVTEKKTENGWEMRRLLDKDQFANFFREIDLKIYEEMSRVE
jgi:hypothetical protein